MISNRSEFGESTAFERWALSGLVPLPPTRPYQAVKELVSGDARLRDHDGGHIKMVTGGTLRIRQGAAQGPAVDLRPFAFGAAWKVVDLLLELAFHDAGHRPRRFNKWSIDEKRRLANEEKGHCPPLAEVHGLYETLAAVYAATVEIRHSLVHRRADVERDTGTLVGVDEHGNELAPITANEQEAFARVAQRAADAVISASLAMREENDLAWQLDQLESHHRRGNLGGIKMVTPRLVLVRLTDEKSTIELDIPAILASGRATFPEGALDLGIELEDGQWLVAEFESLPVRVLQIDVSDPPDWLRREDGSGQPHR